MGRRNKRSKRGGGKGSGSGSVAPVRMGTEAAGRVVAWIREALREGRGRRALTLADRLIAGGGGMEAGEEAALIALASELRIRELYRDGHDTQAAELAKRLCAQAPAAAAGWPLGLCIRLGMAPELPDPEVDEGVRARLRRETLDPVELTGCPWEATARDARRVLEAWDLVDAGDLDGAEAALREVGRRSALIDWRLFLQAQVALRRRVADAYEANRVRIDPESPAAWLLESPADGAAETGLPASPRDLVAGWDGAAEPRQHAERARRLTQTVSRLRAAGHPAFAGLFATCCVADAAPEKGFGVYTGAISMIRREMLAAGLRLTWHMESSGGPDCEEAISMLLSQPGLSPREQAVLLVLRCENALRLLADPRKLFEATFFSDYDLQEIRAEKCIAWARRAARLWPELETAYEAWDQAEAHAGQTDCRALQAWREAVPGRPELLRRHLTARIERGAVDGMDADIETLATLPGEAHHAADLRSRLHLARARQAAHRRDVASVDALAGVFVPRDAKDRVAMATFQWLAADSRGEKAKRGRALGQEGSAWLVCALARAVDEDLTFSKLPMGVRRGLSDPPDFDQYVQDFIETCRAFPREILPLLDWPGARSAYKQMVHALNVPALIRDFLDVLLLRHAGGISLAGQLAATTFELTRKLIRQEDPRWIGIGLGGRAALLSVMATQEGVANTLLTGELRTLLRTARAQFPDPAEAQTDLAPYLQHTGVTWASLRDTAAAIPPPNAILAREFAYFSIDMWTDDVLERIDDNAIPTRRGKPRRRGGALPQFEIPYDEDDDEFDDEDEDEQEYESAQVIPFGKREDLELPKHPPTTHLEAEILLDRILEIEDEDLRLRRANELEALIERSHLKPKTKASLVEAINLVREFAP